MARRGGWGGTQLGAGAVGTLQTGLLARCPCIRGDPIGRRGFETPVIGGEDIRDYLESQYREATTRSAPGLQSKRAASISMSPAGGPAH
jgi:hypothetical protein